MPDYTFSVLACVWTLQHLRGAPFPEGSALTTIAWQPGWSSQMRSHKSKSWPDTRNKDWRLQQWPLCLSGARVTLLRPVKTNVPEVAVLCAFLQSWLSPVTPLWEKVKHLKTQNILLSNVCLVSSLYLQSNSSEVENGTSPGIPQYLKPLSEGYQNAWIWNHLCAI